RHRGGPAAIRGVQEAGGPPRVGRLRHHDVLAGRRGSRRGIRVDPQTKRHCCTVSVMAELRSYICCLRNRENGGGLCAELFYTDPVEAEKFKQKYDKPGVGIYDCISKLVGDRRCKENVGQVDYLVVDIDTKDLAGTSVNEIILRLTQCLLQPTEIRISG